MPAGTHLDSRSEAVGAGNSEWDPVAATHFSPPQRPDTLECVREVRSGKTRLHRWGGFSLAGRSQVVVEVLADHVGWSFRSLFSPSLIESGGGWVRRPPKTMAPGFSFGLRQRIFLNSFISVRLRPSEDQAQFLVVGQLSLALGQLR